MTENSPTLATYDAVATYTNGIKDTSYEVMITVDYEEVGLSLLQKVLIVTAGIAILSIIIGLILMILKKKMEKNKNAVH